MLRSCFVSKWLLERGLARAALGMEASIVLDAINRSIDVKDSPKAHFAKCKLYLSAGNVWHLIHA